MIERGSNEQRERFYKSYEEYLVHFYGPSTEQSYTTLRLEASFGKRLAKRVLEVEAAEKRPKNPTDA